MGSNLSLISLRIIYTFNWIFMIPQFQPGAFIFYCNSMLSPISRSSENRTAPLLQPSVFKYLAHRCNVFLSMKEQMSLWPRA